MAKKYLITKDFLTSSGLLYAIPPTANLTKSNADSEGVYLTYTWELTTAISGLPAKWVSTLTSSYTSRTLVIYDSDKTTALKTIVYTRTLDADGNLITETVSSVSEGD